MKSFVLKTQMNFKQLKGNPQMPEVKNENQKGKMLHFLSIFIFFFVL